MLTICVKLHSISVTISGRIAHAGLKSAGKSEIHRKVKNTASQFLADLKRMICTSVIDDQIIILRTVFLQIRHHVRYVLFFIICWNNDQQRTPHKCSLL